LGEAFELVQWIVTLAGPLEWEVSCYVVSRIYPGATFGGTCVDFGKVRYACDRGHCTHRLREETPPRHQQSGDRPH